MTRLMDDVLRKGDEMMLFGFSTGFYLSYLIPSVIVLVLMVTARSHLRRQVCFSLFCVGLVIAVGGLLLLTWILRDGLGPDSTTSHGAEAMQRFVSDAWPLVSVCLILALFAASLNHWTKKKLNKSKKESQNKALEATA